MLILGSHISCRQEEYSSCVSFFLYRTEHAKKNHGLNIGRLKNDSSNYRHHVQNYTMEKNVVGQLFPGDQTRHYDV